MNKPLCAIGKVISICTFLLSINKNALAQPATHLNFNGTNNYLSCPSVNLSNQSFTIEFRAQRQGGFGQYQYFFSQGAGNSDQLASLLFRTNNTFAFSFWSDDLESTTTVSDANWHHYAVTYNAATKLQAMYIDGALNVSRTASANTTASGPLYVGGFLGATQTFNGNIDEFRVWNSALPANEITRMMNCELQGTESGLIRYYKFNQGTSAGNNSGLTTLTDATSGANHGTLTNFALAGSTSNWLAGSPITTGSAIPSAPAASAQYFCSANNPTVANLLPASATTKWYTAASGGAALTTSTPLSTGNYYVASANAAGCESARTSVSVTVYTTIPVPGVSTPVSYIQGATPTTLTATGSYLRWYTASTGGTGSYSAPLPSTAAVGTTSYWVSQTIGTCEGSRSQVNVVVTAATATHLNFDGVSNFVNCGVKTGYDFAAGTVEAWVRPAASNSNRVLMANRTAANNTYARWSLHLNQSAGTVGLYDGYNFTALNIGTITPGTWYHLAFTMTSTNVGVYVNGVYKGSIPAGINTAAYGNPLLIGASDLTNSFPAEYWSGDMDEVRIWSGILSADDISRRKNCELQGNETGLIAYYKFNQGTSGNSNPNVNTLFDATANINNGSLTNFALTGSASNWLSGSGVTTGSAVPGALAASAQSFCGSAMAPSLSPAPGATVKWYSAATGGSAFTSSTAITASGTYYLTAANAYGCESERTPITLTINAATLAAANANSVQSMSGTTYFPTSCTSLIASVTPSGASPISGSTTTKVWIESTQPSQYVKRHYEITPAANASTATGTISLYFTQAEFNAFNAVNSVKLPAGAGDAAGIANLKIEKRSGTSSNGTGLPNTYSGSIVTITPSSVIWNTGAGRWEVTFSVTGFSGFFVKTFGSVLPVNLVSFNGAKQTDNSVLLQWKTSNETRLESFEIDRSLDGSGFQRIGNVTPNATAGLNNYTFTDNSPWTNDLRYYRLKFIDSDGGYKYSAVVRIAEKQSGISIYPNPVSREFTLQVTDRKLLHTQATLVDVNGKKLRVWKIDNEQTLVDISAVAAGTYLLRLDNGQSVKLIKE